MVPREPDRGGRVRGALRVDAVRRALPDLADLLECEAIPSEKLNQLPKLAHSEGDSERCRMRTNQLAASL